MARQSRPFGGATSPARDLALIAVFAAFIAVLGLPGAVAPFGNAVPITLQTFGVMLAASLLGARRAGLSVLLFLVLVAAGLPLLAGGRGGLAVFVGPSAGYLLGWLVGAVVTGYLMEHGPARLSATWCAAANVIGCVVVVYAIGVPVQALVTGTSLGVAAATSLAFVPGDLIKVALTTIVTTGVHRALPGVLPTSRPARPRANAVR